MKRSLDRQVLRQIRQRQLLHAGDRIGVAVSGGGDSVALLRLLEDLRSELGITLSVLHFNHQLRGRESDEEQTFVESLARSSGLPCIVDRAETARVSRHHKWNLEDAARRLRYEFFERILGQKSVSHVATAHTADDQAETVLARIVRGSGPAGLASIHPVRGQIIRPLLATRREDLRDYLRNRGQEWREDSTNQDTRRLRSRLRHRLLPDLERGFSPDIVDRLCDLAELGREDEIFWSALVEKQLRGLISHTPDGLSVPAASLLAPMPVFDGLPPSNGNTLLALTRRLIRRMHAEVSAGQGQLSRSHVEQVIRFAAHASSGRALQLPGAVEVRREFERLSFRHVAPGRPANQPQRTSPRFPSYQYEVSIPPNGSATVSVPELGRSYRLKLIDWPLGERDTMYYGRVLDPERLRAPLILRNWRPGDAYLPCGRRQARKLNRMLIARRITVTKRTLWPVLTSAGEVAWADEMPVAAEFSPDERTRKGLMIFAENC